MKQKHTFYRRRSTKKLAKVSSSNNNHSLESYDPCCLTRFALFMAGSSWQRAAFHRSCSASQAATTALVMSTRAAVDRCGPGHEQGPQKTARAGEEDHEMHFTATFRAHPPPLAGVQHFSLDDDEPPAAGSRPDRLSAVSGCCGTPCGADG